MNVLISPNLKICKKFVCDDLFHFCGYMASLNVTSWQGIHGREEPFRKEMREASWGKLRNLEFSDKRKHIL